MRPAARAPCGRRRAAAARPAAATQCAAGCGWPSAGLQGWQLLDLCVMGLPAPGVCQLPVGGTQPPGGIPTLAARPPTSAMAPASVASTSSSTELPLLAASSKGKPNGHSCLWNARRAPADRISFCSSDAHPGLLSCGRLPAQPHGQQPVYAGQLVLCALHLVCRRARGARHQLAQAGFLRILGGRRGGSRKVDAPRLPCRQLARTGHQRPVPALPWAGRAAHLLGDVARCRCGCQLGADGRNQRTQVT